MNSKPCPFCGESMPQPQYNEETHQMDLTPVTDHMNSCKYKVEVDQGRSYE